MIVKDKSNNIPVFGTYVGGGSFANAGIASSRPGTANDSDSANEIIILYKSSIKVGLSIKHKPRGLLIACGGACPRKSGYLKHIEEEFNNFTSRLTLTLSSNLTGTARRIF